MKFFRWLMRKAKERRQAWLERELADVEAKIVGLSSETVESQRLLKEVGSPEGFNQRFMLRDREILNDLKERRDWIKGELSSL